MIQAGRVSAHEFRLSLRSAPCSPRISWTSAPLVLTSASGDEGGKVRAPTGGRREVRHSNPKASASESRLQR